MSATSRTTRHNPRREVARSPPTGCVISRASRMPRSRTCRSRTCSNELLARVVEILDADTAAILLLEDDDTTLVARAAKGLEEEVERGVRIPVGGGSPGASRRRGSRSRSRTSTRPRSSTRSCARRACARCSACRCSWRAAVIGVHARRHAHRAHVQRRGRRAAAERRRPGRARDLQPPDRARARPRGRAPAQPHAATSRCCRRSRSRAATCPRRRPSSAATGTTPSRFRTAGSGWRSGTWSAAASTPPRSWASCAAACAPTRSTACRPARCSSRLSRLLRQLEPGRTATLVYLVLDPYGGSLVVSSAGHPPPLVDRRGDGPDFIELPGLGAARRRPPSDLRGARALGRAGSRSGALHGRSGGARRRVARRGTRAADDGRAGPARRTSSTSATAWSTSCCRRGRREDDAALLLARALPLSDTLVTQLARRGGVDPARCAGCSGAGCTRRARPRPRRRTSRWRPRRRARTRSSTRTGSRPGSLEVSASISRGGEAMVAVRDFGSWRAAARREPGPRAAAHGGPHGLRRGDPRRGRHDRRAVPAPRSWRRRERAGGA